MTKPQVAYYATAKSGDLHEVFPMYRTGKHPQGGYTTAEGAPIASYPTWYEAMNTTALLNAELGGVR